MLTRPRTYLTSATLLCAVALSAAAQQGPAANVAYRLRLMGIYDDASGDPVEGVKVSDVLSGASSLTTVTGTVSLVFLPEGGSMVRLQKVGYATQTFTVAISPADTAPLTITMKRLTQLPTMVTTDSAPHYFTSGLRGFAERARARTGGYFITEAEIRKAEGRSLGNMLRRQPSVYLAEQGSNSMLLLRPPACNNGGPPQVYLDGVMLAPDIPSRKQVATARTTVFAIKDSLAPPPTLLPFDLSRYDLSSLAGIEWYPSNETLPIEFAHTSERCGALLLWTRER